MLAWFFLVSAALHGCLHSQDRLASRSTDCFRRGRAFSGLAPGRTEAAEHQGPGLLPGAPPGARSVGLLPGQTGLGCRKTRTGGAGAKSPGAGAAFRPAAGAAHSQQACGGALVLRSARAPQPPARARGSRCRPRVAAELFLRKDEARGPPAAPPDSRGSPETAATPGLRGGVRVTLSPSGRPGSAAPHPLTPSVCF